METKFIVTKRFGTIALTKNADGYWQDKNGTLYAYTDGKSVDPVERCGVWPFALPTWPIFKEVNKACGVHDKMYSMPVYQAFHTRLEADVFLKHLVELAANPIIAEVFEDLARQLGAGYWENERTNN